MPIGVACIVRVPLLVTFAMHRYWTATDPMPRISQRVNVRKNVALLGAERTQLMIERPRPLSWNTL